MYQTKVVKLFWGGWNHNVVNEQAITKFVVCWVVYLVSLDGGRPAPPVSSLSSCPHDVTKQQALISPGSVSVMTIGIIAIVEFAKMP